MSGPTDGHDRAQLVIVVALVVAVLFVGLAIVLNSSINAENTATADTETESQEVLEQRQAIEAQMAEAADRTNARHPTGDFTTLRDDLALAIDDQAAIHAHDGAAAGVVVDYESIDPQEGIRLRQTDEERNFTPKDVTAERWTLAEGVPDGGQFAMNIQNDSVFVATYDTTMALMAESAFAIEFLVDQEEVPDKYDMTEQEFNDPIAYRIYVFEGSITGGSYAITEYPDQEFRDESFEDRLNPDHIVAGWLNQSCSLESSVITLRLSEGTFGGSPCGHFDFYDEELDDVDAHEVRFNNTVSRDGDVDRARGTYGILLDQTEPVDDMFYSPSEADEDNQPFYQSAVYSFEYNYTYRTSTNEYHVSNSEVLPKAHDPGGILWEHPRIDRFDVTDLSDEEDENAFRVDWRVSDPDAQLDYVELELVDRTIEATEERYQELLQDTLTDDAFDGICEEEGLLGTLCDDDIGEYYEEMTETLEEISYVEQPLNTNTVVDSEVIHMDEEESAEAEGTNDLVDGENLGEGSVYHVHMTVVDTSGRATGLVQECEAGENDCELLTSSDYT